MEKFHVNTYFKEGGLKAETLRVLKTAEENISNGKAGILYGLPEKRANSFI